MASKETGKKIELISRKRKKNSVETAIIKTNDKKNNSPLQLQKVFVSSKYIKPCVVPDIRIPEREGRRPPRQCNWKKGEVYY